VHDHRHDPSWCPPSAVNAADGIVTITKVAAASPSNDDGLRYVLNERGKRVKTLPLVNSLMIGATGISVTNLLR